MPARDRGQRRVGWPAWLCGHAPQNVEGAALLPCPERCTTPRARREGVPHHRPERRYPMKKPSSIVTLCVLVTFVLAFQVSPSMADTDREDICTWNFEATVRQGPHAGESFAGTLTVVIAKHGTLTGVLVTDAPETILVVGQVNGRAVNLAVALQEIDQETEGLYLF